VAVVDEQHFITGGDNGDIILWSLNKKRPQYIKRTTHDFDPSPLPSQHSAELNPPEDTSIPPQPRWITCLTSLPYTDLFFSGSWDGRLGMWRVTEDLRRFELVRWIELGVRGVVNGICVSEVGRRGEEGVRVTVAVGTEGRLGRWKTVKGGKNCVIVLEMGRE
jgi:ribosomal RNA-processing protein 9